MGTTLTAMQSGSIASVKVCAIEGYSNLITEGETAAAVTAWSGTDWSAALSNAIIKVHNDQKFNPWQPFQGGGTAEIWVQPDDTDRFGTDLHRTVGGHETELTETHDRTATTLNVLDTSTFGSSGTVYVGNECITYASLGGGGTTIEGCTRGMYSPFGVYGGTRFAQHHRAGLVDDAVNIQPKVTQYRRTWIGAWVGIWEHRVVGGALDVKSEAQCVFAGQIAEVRVDADTGWTVVQVEHVLNVIAGSTLLADQYRAKVEEGMHISATGLVLQANDNLAGSALAANNLTLTEGQYTAAQIASAIQAWLTGEVNAGRLNSTITINSPDESTSGPRTKIDVVFSSAGATAHGVVTLQFPGEIAALLGLQPVANDLWVWTADAVGAQPVHYISNYAPMFALLGVPSAYHFTVPSLVLTEEVGTFYDNYDAMPVKYNGQPLKPAVSDSLEWGLFLVANSFVVLGARFVSGGVTYLGNPSIFDLDNNNRFRYGSVDPDGIPIVQIVALSYYWASVLKRFFYSSGTAAYNQSVFDSLPYRMGVAVPGALLGTDFDASCIGVGGYGINHPIWLTKPIKISELLGADLVMQGKFLIWRNGALRFSQWATPVADDSVATLDETNKAAPVGDRGSHRCATVISKEWAKPIIKIQYDYDWKADKYRGELRVEDRTYVDSTGGDPVTISCRNLDEAHLQQLMPTFLARVPMVTRPMHKIRRSIDMRYYEGYAPGDVVLLSDNDARDPATGTRGVVSRPALIIGHSYDPGGPVPGKIGSVTQTSGEVDLFVVATNRAAGYSPCAQVDDTATNSGYNAGTGALTCYDYQHSESTGAVDATYFVAGDKIRIIEIDPVDPAAPTTWTRTIATVVGSVITPTSTLSSPAWNSALKYRIVSHSYSNAVTSQKVDSYQASGTTGLLNSTEQPYEYAIPQDAAYTDETHTALAELHAEASYGDGVPRDPGYDRGLIRTINNLIDHKTAHQSPSLSSTAYTYSGSGTYQLLMVSPIYVGAALYSGQSRSLYVAPWFRSTDGTSVTIRVTLIRSLPTGTSVSDAPRTLPSSGQTWSTSSTTWATGSEKALDLYVPTLDGWAYLLIEGTSKCSTRGLAQCIERERT